MSLLKAQTVGTKVIVSERVPEGQVILGHDLGSVLCGVKGGPTVMYAGPLTCWSMRHEGRWPFQSRFCPGMRELDRDRRRNGSAS